MPTKTTPLPDAGHESSPSNSQPTESRQQEGGLILVVGDWFVDDHWVVGAYRSSTSSRTGRKHLAALQEIDSTTESLCGAGRTASVLWGAGFQILGVGICARSDEKVLLSLLAAKTLRGGRNPHTLRRWGTARKPHGADFCNLGDERCGTSRAIRVYERVGAATALTQRIDWEAPVPTRLNTNALKKLLRERKREIRAVVIQDLAKGLVRRELIALLAKQLGDKAWFISTKIWEPSWLDELEPVKRLRVRLVPEVAARAALGTRIDDDKVVRRALTSWMATRAYASKGAIALVENKLLKGKRRPTVETVVAVPDDRTILALDAAGRGYVHRQEISGERVPTAMSSVLLGALTGRMLAAPEADLADIVRSAAGFTYRWRAVETRRVTHYRQWKPVDEPQDDLRIERADGPDPGAFDWRAAHERWKDAFTLDKLGIIEAADGPRLELWRAMTELPGYLCIVRRKRETVAGLVQMMRTFARSDRAKQESCLIEAPSGAGKTHLVRCLAELENYHVLQFNITHLYRWEGLLDCFDRISTTQVDLHDTPLLIFFDEINAPLEGEEGYGSFLSPLEEGTYVRAEKSFHIGPAVWLFAGTKFDPTRPKAADFQSRLTRGIVPLGVPDEDPEGDSARLERVYLGAALLRSAFPEVEVIAEDVLDFFKRLPGELSLRRIADLTRNFRDVKRRTIVGDNIPWAWIDDQSERGLGGFRSLRADWEGYWNPRRDHVREVRLIAREN